MTILVTAAPALSASQDWERAVAASNPELAAFDARIRAALARVAPAGAWSDPVLEAEVMVMDGTAAPRIKLEQMTPLLGQPALMARMSQLEADMLRAERDERQLMIVADANQVLIELAYVARVRQILTRTQDLARGMSRVAEARYGTGQGMQTDVLRAHVAQTRLLAPNLELEARRSAAVARWDALAPAVPRPPVTLVDAAALPSLSDGIARAMVQSPVLQMRRLAVTHAEAGLALAERERVPDLGLGLSGGQWMPGNMPFVAAMASAPIPVWFGSKQQPRVVAAASQLAAQRKLAESAVRELQARISALHAQAVQADEHLRLVRSGLLVQARQTFQAAMAAYTVNQGDFLMILDALMAFYDVEMGEAMALAERLKMAAMLQALIGVPAQEEAPR